MSSAAPSVRHPAVAVAQVPRWTTPVDVAVAAGLALWGLAEVAVTPQIADVRGVLFAIASTLPLAVRRRFPCTVTVVIVAVLLTHAAGGEAGATFTPFPSLLLATFTVAVQVAPLWRALVVGVLPGAGMVAATGLGYFGPEATEPRGLSTLAFFVVGAWAGGRVVHHRALAALAAERDVEGAAQRAVAEERARIARELHDVVAHAVSVVVLQTGAAEGFLDRDTDRARTHLALARRTAGEAMTEMRRLLDVLREDGPVYVPQPGLERLPELVDDARASGLDVTLAMPDLEAPGRVAVSDGTSLAAYRVVQESLTNALKHAPRARTTVTVTLTPVALDLAVLTAAPSRRPVTGPPPVEPGAVGAGPVEPGPVEPGPVELRGGGHGLPGMRERVRVYGGSLDVGPTADGGWVVRASLPLVSA